MIPEMSMFYVYKAGKLHCPNSEGCFFCEHTEFCQSLAKMNTLLLTKYKDQVEKFESLDGGEGGPGGS